VLLPRAKYDENIIEFNIDNNNDNIEDLVVHNMMQRVTASIKSLMAR
jgi:hypothetical protein